MVKKERCRMGSFYFTRNAANALVRLTMKYEVDQIRRVKDATGMMNKFNGQFQQGRSLLI